MSAPSSSEKQGESGLTMWNAPTRADGTVRDLRRFSCKIENSDDRELVQHAADMLEIAMRQLCSTVSAKQETVWGALGDLTREAAKHIKNGMDGYAFLCHAQDLLAEDDRRRADKTTTNTPEDPKRE